MRAIRNLMLLMALAGPAAAQGQPLVIAALGDSLTHGYGLPPEEGFTAELQRWLDANGPVKVTVINAGVSGDTTAGGRARLDWTLTPDVNALIVELGGNDLLRGIDPAETRANLDAILTEAGRRGLPVLLAGLPGPQNYGPEYKAEFDAIFPELAQQHGAILYPNFLAGLSGLSDPAQRRGMMQEDGLHPSAAGVRRIVEAIGPSVLRLVAAVTGG